MLGMDNALATRCYNTCFTLHGANGTLRSAVRLLRLRPRPGRFGENRIMTSMTTELLIDSYPCMVYAMPEPRCLVLTTLVWHNGGHFTDCTLRLAQPLL